MGTRSRPPGCGAGPLGRMPLRDCRRMRPCASCRALSPVDIKSPACPPARRRDWCCSGSSSSPSHRAHRMLQGSFPSQNLRRFAEVQGETGSVRAYTHTHTHTHTHAVGALRINIIYHARRFMRTCVHARINAGITQLSLLARLLLFENPCSPESLLLARRCMWVYVFACV